MLGRILSVVKEAVTTIGVSDPRPKTYLAKLFHEPRYREVIDIIKEHVGSGIRVLIDVGCGRGALYEFLSEEGIEVGLYVCCDIEVTYLQEVKGEGVDRVLCDAHYLPFRRGAAGLVICSEVLEHLQRPLKALSNILSVSGQRALITFPDERVKNALGFRYPEHISEINLTEVVYLAGLQGYRVGLHRRLYFAIPPTIFDKVFSFSHMGLKIFSALLRIFTHLPLASELCLIKTEIILLDQQP
jgi:SAM-dependent methyltransferase